MTTNKRNLLVNARTRAVVALLLGAGVVTFASASCSEPAPKCTVALGSFAATYTLVSGTGPCAQLTGEVLNVYEYTAAGANDYPDYDKASVAIAPSALATASAAGTDENSGDLPYGIGPFAGANPGDSGFCKAPALNAARVRTPAAAAVTDGCTPTPAQPAVDLEYAFSNVQVLSTTRALGTQLFADLAYTDHVAGCSAQYQVAAVYPAVSCGAAAPVAEAGAADDAALPDAASEGGDVSMDGGDAGVLASEAGIADASPPLDCGPPAAATPPAGPMVPSLQLCSPVDTGTGFASGLSPDYDIKCDPTLLLCVLNNPAFPR